MLAAKILRDISNQRFSLPGKIDVLLIFLILVGTVFRFCYPFFSHPLDHLDERIYSDSLRHYGNAMGNFNKNILSWLDPPFPQIWLRTILLLCHNTRFGIALYFGFLCAVTPWCWYLWARKIFSDQRKAMVYLVAMIWLPSWIGIYGFFMDETLLLPALGLTLWLSWRAREKNTAKYLLIAMVAWTITLSIKLSALFELVFVGPWLFFHFMQQNGYRTRSYVVLSIVLSLLAATYLSYPIWVYQGLRATWLYPPGMGGLTKIFYFSGATQNRIYFVSRKSNVFWTVSFYPYPNRICSLRPFSEWRTWRHGGFSTVIDCDKKFYLTLPAPKLSLEKHMLFATEATIYFFFSPSWPELDPRDLIHVAQVNTRWIWSLLTVAVVVLTWQKKKFKDIITVMLLGTTLLYVLCDSAMATGRYRKPWEGIAIAAFIYLLDFGKNKRLSCDNGQ